MSIVHVMSRSCAGPRLGTCAPRDDRTSRPLGPTPSRGWSGQGTVKVWSPKRDSEGRAQERLTARQRHSVVHTRVAPAGTSLLPMHDADGSSVLGCPMARSIPGLSSFAGLRTRTHIAVGNRLLAPVGPGVAVPRATSWSSALLHRCAPRCRAAHQLRTRAGLAASSPTSATADGPVGSPDLRGAPRRSLGVARALTTRCVAPPMSSYPFSAPP